MEMDSGSGWVNPLEAAAVSFRPRRQGAGLHLEQGTADMGREASGYVRACEMIRALPFG
jgi:hypothetical protein